MNEDEIKLDLWREIMRERASGATYPGPQQTTAQYVPQVSYGSWKAAADPIDAANKANAAFEILFRSPTAAAPKKPSQGTRWKKRPK